MKVNRDDLGVAWSAKPMGFGDIMQLLRRQIVPLVVIPTVCVAIGFVYAIFASPRYSATALISVDADNITADALNALMPSHMATIGSPEVTTRVVDKLHLGNDIVVERGLLDRLMADLRDALGVETKLEISDAERRTAVVDIVADDLDVERVEASAVISVNYTAESPGRAAETANAYAESYIDLLVDQSRAATQSRAEFIRTRIGEVQRLAAAAYQDLRKIRSADGQEPSGVDDLNNRIAAVLQTRSQFDGEEATLKARLALVSHTNSVESLEAAALQAEGGSAVFDAYKAELDKLDRAKLVNPSSQATAQLEASVVNLRGQLELLLARNQTKLEQELEILSARGSSIAEELRQTLSLTGESNWSDMLLAENQANVLQNIYSDYLKELEVVYGREGVVTVAMTARANPSLEPTWPRYQMILALAAMSGLIIAAAVVMLREWRRAFGGWGPVM